MTFINTSVSRHPSLLTLIILAEAETSLLPSIDIESMYDQLREYLNKVSDEYDTIGVQEEFWREIEHAENKFDTISSYMYIIVCTIHLSR